MAAPFTSLVPHLSVDQFLVLLDKTDFKDKSFKILGGLSKLQALAGHPAEKDLMAFARVLSMARKYIKFGKSLQSYRQLDAEVKPVGDLPASYVKFEEWVDFVQLLVEDLNTLHKGRFLKALGIPNIPRLDRLEDQAWWLWSGVSSCLFDSSTFEAFLASNISIEHFSHETLFWELMHYQISMMGLPQYRDISYLDTCVFRWLGFSTMRSSRWPVRSG